MISAVNNKFVELQKIQRSFDAYPTPVPTMLVTLKEIQSEKICLISINPLSVHWKFFLFILENPNCVPHNIYLTCKKLILAKTIQSLKSWKLLTIKSSNDILIPKLPYTITIF